MKIEIKLKNPKYCYSENNDCPCFKLQGYLFATCKYYDIDLMQDKKGVVRPKKCIEENGE